MAPGRRLGGGAGGSCLSIDAKTVREYRRLYRCGGTACIERVAYECSESARTPGQPKTCKRTSTLGCM